MFGEIEQCIYTSTPIQLMESRQNSSRSTTQLHPQAQNVKRSYEEAAVTIVGSHRSRIGIHLYSDVSGGTQICTPFSMDDTEDEMFVAEEVRSLERCLSLSVNIIDEWTYVYLMARGDRVILPLFAHLHRGWSGSEGSTCGQIIEGREQVIWKQSEGHIEIKDPHPNNRVQNSLTHCIQNT